MDATETSSREYPLFRAKKSLILYECNFDKNVAEELQKCGLASGNFRDMALPSFLPFYIHLIHIPKDIMQECIQIRLDQQPKNPSLLSIQQVCYR